jgi:hypothetical protein
MILSYTKQESASPTASRAATGSSKYVADRRSVRVLRLAAAALASITLLLAACAARRFDPPIPSDGWREVARGDWDDLDAAVEVACMRHEIALVTATDEPPDAADAAQRVRRRTFNLVTAGSEPVRIDAASTGASDPGDIVLTVRVGRFGDQRRERAIARTMTRRLRDLAGVTVAPLRE